MLVLSTELESGIRIGDNITIKVLDVRTRHVRL
ncbi:MAG: carbon storage regulator, partial [Phycisphaerales bacterium]